MQGEKCKMENSKFRVDRKREGVSDPRITIHEFLGRGSFRLQVGQFDPGRIRGRRCENTSAPPSLRMANLRTRRSQSIVIKPKFPSR